MNTSHIESERLVGAGAGSLELTAAERTHLSGCAECRFELELVTSARRLGVGAVSALDPERISGVVRARLAAERSRKRRSPMRTVWLAGLATAAALILAVRVSREPAAPIETGLPTAVAEASVLHELDDLSEPELEEVLQTLPTAAGAVLHVETAPLSELNANDLEQVLRSMEE